MFTFMYCVITPGFSGCSPLWQESAAIRPVSEPAVFSAELPGFVTAVPEPSSFVLAGFGAFALLVFFRHRGAEKSARSP